MMRDRANITLVIRYEVIYLSSNGTIANIVHRHIDLHFRGHKILISENRWELAKNCQLYLLYMLIFAIEWYHWECCTLWLMWSSFQNQQHCGEQLFQRNSKYQIVHKHHFSTPHHWLFYLQRSIWTVLTVTFTMLNMDSFDNDIYYAQ